VEAQVLSTSAARISRTTRKFEVVLCVTRKDDEVQVSASHHRLPTYSISIDTSSPVAGVCQFGSRGTHSLTVNKIHWRHLKVFKSSISSVDCFSAFCFVLGFCFLKNSQFKG